MRTALQSLLSRLLAGSAQHKQVSLDAIGEAVGALHISHEEIDALIHALEEAGRSVVGPEGGGLEQHLQRVISTARELSGELGRKPNVVEIATRAALTPEQVRHTLALVQVMQRGK